MITPHFQPANPASTLLEPGEVHLWRYRFGQDDPVDEEQSSILSKAERDRAERVANPDRRARIVESRIILRHLLAGYMSLHPAEVKIRKGKLGRPTLDTRHRNTDLGFNLSHSGDLMMLAVAIDKQLGVDVELLRTRPDLDKLARRVFSVDEQTALAAVGEAGYLAAFFQGWTRKEALLKGAGAGIFRQANATEVSLADAYRPQIHKYQGSRELAKERCLLSFQPQEGAVGALSMSAGAWRIKYFAFESGVFQHHLTQPQGVP